MNNHEKRNLKNNIDKNFIYNKIEETKLHENNETLNSFEKSVNLINNDSKTILSDDKPNLSNYNLKRDLNNNFTANPKFYKNINHNKFQKKTIETVLENEKEENFTYYQYSDDNELINNPIVTFIFYKEENYEIIELENKKNNKSVAIDVNRSLKLNEELSISLNLNNFKDNVGFNFTANSNNNKNTHINEIIDNISQSEIFSNLNGVNDKSLDTLEKFNQNYKQKVNLENSNINENILPKNLNKERPKSEEIDGNSQTVKYKILYSEIIKACPIIQLSADTSKNIIVKMPRWISINDFNIYLNIIKNGTEYNSVFTYNKLLLLSDFFENNDFVEKLVKENIIPNFDLSNVIDYLENSYLKLSSSKENSLPVSISWFELFIKAIDFVSKKFVFYLNPENSILLDKLSLLNKKILEELIDKSIEQIISHPFIFDDEILNESEIFNNLSQSNLCENINFLKHEVYEKLIDFLHKLRNTNNIFDLLMNEYLRISSNEVINEINNLPNATLNLEIPVDINNYYKEFLIDLNIYNKMVVFIVYYKKSDDSLNVSFKLKNNDYENESPPNLLNNKEKIKGEKKKNSQWNIFGSLSNFINFNNNDDGTQNFALNNNNNVFKKKIFFQNGKKNFNFKKEIDFNKFTIFKILSFLSVVTVNDEKNKTQVNINIIANNYNKSSFPIFKLNNFSKIIDDLITQQNKESCFKNNNLGNINNLNNIDINAFSGTIEFVSLKINLKPCNTHSAITSFILNNFQKFYFDNSIYKISKQFLMLLIKNRNHIKKNEDHVVIAFFNWLNDELNLKEDCEDLCQAINWQLVSTEHVIEFLLKYPKLIKNSKIEIVLKQSLQNSVFNSVQKQNILIKNYYNDISKSFCGQENRLNAKLIEESIFETVSIFFKNLLKLGKDINYSKNYLQIQKLSRLNSVDFGYNSNKSSRINTQENHNYHNTDANIEKYNYNINSQVNKAYNFKDLKNRKISIRNNKQTCLSESHHINNFYEDVTIQKDLFSFPSQTNGLNKFIKNPVDNIQGKNENLINDSFKKLKKKNYKLNEKIKESNIIFQQNYIKEDPKFQKNGFVSNKKGLKFQENFSLKKKIETINKESQIKININPNKTQLTDHDKTINKNQKQINNSIFYKKIHQKDISLHLENYNSENANLTNKNDIDNNETKFSKSYSDYKKNFIKDSLKYDNSLDSYSPNKISKTSTSSIDNLTVPPENLVFDESNKELKVDIAKISIYEDSNSNILNNDMSFISCNIPSKHKNSCSKNTINLIKDNLAECKFKNNWNSFNNLPIIDYEKIFKDYIYYFNPLKTGNPENKLTITKFTQKDNLYLKQIKTTDNFKNLFDEDKTLEVNINNEEKKDFSTFNNIIKFFENQVACEKVIPNQIKKNLERKIPNEVNSKFLISNNNDKSEFEIQNNSKKVIDSNGANSEDILNRCINYKNNKNYTSKNYKDSSKDIKNIDKKYSFKTNNSKEKSHINIGKNHFNNNNQNYESTVSHTNTNNFINSSSNSYIFNNNNLISKNEKMDSSFKNQNEPRLFMKTKANLNENNLEKSSKKLINNKLKDTNKTSYNFSKISENQLGSTPNEYFDEIYKDDNLNSRKLEILNTDGNINSIKIKKTSKNLHFVISNDFKNINKNDKYNIFNNYTSKPKNLSEINNSNIKNLFKNRMERKNLNKKYSKKAKNFSLLGYINNNQITNFDNSHISKNDIDYYHSTNLNMTTNCPNLLERKKSNNISVNINSSSESNFGNVKYLNSHKNSYSKKKRKELVIKKNNSISHINKDKKEKTYKKDINPIKYNLIDKIDRIIDNFNNNISPIKPNNKYNVNAIEHTNIVKKNKITSLGENSKILVNKNTYSSNSQSLLNIFNKRPSCKPSSKILKKSIKMDLIKNNK